QLSDTSVEMEFWKSMQNSTDPKDYKAYLDEYPNGKFAKLASNRLESLTAESNLSSTTASSHNESAEPAVGAGVDPILPTGQFVHISAGEFLMGSNSG